MPCPFPILDDDVPTTQCSTRTSGHIDAQSRAMWHSCSSAAPLPALLEIVEPPLWQALIPATETSGQRPQDSTSARPPRLYPPLRVSTDGKGEENTRIRGFTPPRNRGKEPQYRCPSESFKSLQFRMYVGTTTHPLWPIITNHFPLWIY